MNKYALLTANIEDTDSFSQGNMWVREMGGRYLHKCADTGSRTIVLGESGWFWNPNYKPFLLLNIKEDK